MARQSSSRRRRCPGWRQLAWTWCRGQRWPCSLLQPEPPRCTPCGWPRSWESSRCARACLCRWSSGHSPRPWRLRRTPHRRASRRRKVPGDRPLRRSEPVERVSAVCRTGHEASCCTSHYAAPGQSYPCPRGKSRFSNDTKKVRSRFQNIWNLSARLETPARAWQGKGLSSAAAGSLNSWWEFDFRPFRFSLKDVPFAGLSSRFRYKRRTHHLNNSFPILDSFGFPPLLSSPVGRSRQEGWQRRASHLKKNLVLKNKSVAH